MEGCGLNSCGLGLGPVEGSGETDPGNFLTGWEAISFPSRTLFNGVNAVIIFGFHRFILIF